MGLCNFTYYYITEKVLFKSEIWRGNKNQIFFKYGLKFVLCYCIYYYATINQAQVVFILGFTMWVFTLLKTENNFILLNINSLIYLSFKIKTDTKEHICKLFLETKKENCYKLYKINWEIRIERHC